jgi:peptidyl-prolyl cis-trans isomerase D
MLQRIRDGLHGQKWLAWTVLLLIAATFVFWGGTMNDSGGNVVRDAASVDGDPIAGELATRAWSRQQEQWSRQFGSDIPAERRAQMQDQLLEQLVIDKVIQHRLRDRQFGVGESAVRKIAREEPAFQLNGKYDPAVAKAALAQAGLSESQYFSDTRMSLLRAQLQRGIRQSYFLTSRELERLVALENEEREVRFVVLPVDKFGGSGPVDEAEIKSYYDANGDRFLSTESVALEFAELRVEQLATQVTPSEDDLKQRFEETRDRYNVPERRRSRHILIKVGDDEAAAQKKAEQVLAEAKAPGADFAALAKKYSEDVSGQQGGDLGFTERSAFVGPFADALFAMQVGEVRGPVKSQFGFHIIKLEEIQAGQAKKFEDVRAELDSLYRQDQASELFGERQEALSARLEAGEEDIDKLAQGLGLVRGSVPTFLRGGGAEPLGSSRELQDVVFSDAALNQGKIVGPVGIGDDRLVVVKVTQHRKPEVKPLADVREEIIGLLRHERGVAAAKAAAQSGVEKLNAGESLDKVASSWGLSSEPARFVGRGDPSIPAALRTALFEAARPQGRPIAQTVALDDGASAVYVLTQSRVADSTSNPQLVAQQANTLTLRAATSDLASYVAEARRKAKVTKNPAVFE